MLLLDKLLAIQLLPFTGSKAELTNERQLRQFRQRLVFQKDAVQRDPEHLRELRRRTNERAFGRTMMQVQDDAALLRFARHAHVLPGANA